MKIWVFAHCRNERHLAPWFARHYSAFADSIQIFDDVSDDGTPEILDAYPKVTVHQIQMGGLDEEALLNLAAEHIPRARGHCDYAMWVDMDEFLHAPDIIRSLTLARDNGWDVVNTLGFNMTGAPLPVDDGASQLTSIYRTGVRAPVYSKPVIVNPNVAFEWSRGKHTVAKTNGVIQPWDFRKDYEPDPNRIKLLHYRYLEPDYVRARNARQFDRSTEKNAAWSNRADYTGEHSPEWTASIKHLARDVVRDDACYLRPPLDA